MLKIAGRCNFVQTLWKIKDYIPCWSLLGAPQLPLRPQPFLYSSFLADPCDFCLRMSPSYLPWIKCLSVLNVFTWQALASLYHLVQSVLAEPGPDPQPEPLRLLPFPVFQGTWKNDLMQVLVQTQERGWRWEPLNSCEKRLLICLAKN